MQLRINSQFTPFTKECYLQILDDIRSHFVEKHLNNDDLETIRKCFENAFPKLTFEKHDGEQVLPIESMLNHQIQSILSNIESNPKLSFVAGYLMLRRMYYETMWIYPNLTFANFHEFNELTTYVQYGVENFILNPKLQSEFDLQRLQSILSSAGYIEDVTNYLQYPMYSQTITLYKRYLKKSQGKLFELPHLMYLRIAMFSALNDVTDLEAYAQKYYRFMALGLFTPATPILSNAGTTSPQCSSCFVGAMHDSITGIFTSYTDMAHISKNGGGIAYDITGLRAINSPIRNNPNSAGGIIPWANITNSIALAVDQLGTRKGAIALYLQPWHKEIMSFIDLRDPAGDARMRSQDLFLGLWIDNVFMERVGSDREYSLFNPYDVPDLITAYGNDFKSKYEAYEQNPEVPRTTLRAKDMWKKILSTVYEHGMPFLCFKDNANSKHMNPHKGVIRSSNLCTEIFQITTDGELDNDTLVNNTFAICTLGSVNIDRLMGSLDTTALPPHVVFTVQMVVRFMDNLLDLTYLPIKSNTNANFRPIGIGIMGEADLCAANGIRFGSEEHHTALRYVMQHLTCEVLNASALLARDRGAYPYYGNSEWERITHYQASDGREFYTKYKDKSVCTPDWEGTYENMMHYGLRNGYLIAIAPTSSISLVNGCSPSLEPIYKTVYYEDNLSGIVPIIPYHYDREYTTVKDVEPMDLVKLAITRSRWVDQGMSLNLFAMTSITARELSDLYYAGWRGGLKSFYYLRSQSPTIECGACQ